MNTQELKPTSQSLFDHMIKSITQTDDLETQAKMCSEVAIEYTRLMVDKHIK